MQIFAVFTSDKSGIIPDIGHIKAGEPLVIDEFKIIRIEAKRECTFGEIKIPDGVNLTLHVLEDDEELVLNPKG